MKKLAFVFCALFFATTVILACTAIHYKKKSNHKSVVDIPIQASLFEEKLSKGPPDWMIKQIEADLKAYETSKISKEMLDQFFQGQRIDALNLIRFTIQDRRLSFSLSKKNLDHRQFRHVLAAIEKLNELVVLPNVDFIMSLEDGFGGNLGIPLFVYAKSKEASTLVLMPDFKALTGYPGLRQKIEKGGQKWPWEKKLDKAFWRGSTTGGWLTALNWDQIARVKAALLSKAHPKQIDAQITGVVQCDQGVPELIRAKGLTGNMVAPADHLQYKYLLDVDGNSCSYERYFWLLFSNSLVLKQITPNIQWYYEGLRPYEHFVPVKEDLSDLVEKIEWAKKNDREVKEMASRATVFAKEELSIESTFVYMAHLLREYAKHCSP